MVGDALRRFREKRGMSREKLAEIWGLSKDAVISYENDRRNPDCATILKFEQEFQISFYEVMYDKSLGRSCDTLNDAELELLKLYTETNEQARRIIDYVLRVSNIELPSAHKNELSVVRHIQQSHVIIPVVGRAAAGEPIEMIQSENGSLSIDDEHIQYGDFAVIAAGDSMIDLGINDGDRVVIRPQPIVENGEIALVAIDNDSTIKRFFKDRFGYRLVPANPTYPIQQYPPDYPVRILGKVIKVIK